MPADVSAFTDFSAAFREPPLPRGTLNFSLSALETASLLASRLCHDLISPVGAINNGMELYEEGLGDKEALELIRISAQNASARLQFARLAYGAAGGAGDAVGVSEAERLAQAYLTGGKAQMQAWQSDIFSLPKDCAKLLLNMVFLAAAAIPRGGQINVSLRAGETPEKPHFLLKAEGVLLRLPPDFIEIYQGKAEKHCITAHNIQFYWIYLLSAYTAMPIQIYQNTHEIAFCA